MRGKRRLAALFALPGAPSHAVNGNFHAETESDMTSPAFHPLPRIQQPRPRDDVIRCSKFRRIKFCHFSYRMSKLHIPLISQSHINMTTLNSSHILSISLLFRLSVIHPISLSHPGRRAQTPFVVNSGAIFSVDKEQVDTFPQFWLQKGAGRYKTYGQSGPAVVPSA